MRHLAMFISYLFHPLLGPTYGVLMLLNIMSYKTGISHINWLVVLAFVFIFTFIFPVLIISILKLTNRISDFHLNDREERRIPFAIVAVCYTALYMIINYTLGTSFFSLMFLALSSSVVLSLAFNAFYKISIHAISAGGLVALCMAFMPYFYFDGRYFLLVLILLAGVIGAARLWLKAHTPGQVYSGYIVGFFTVYLILQI